MKIKSRLNDQEFSDSCWEKVQEYVEGVTNDEILVGKYIKKVVERYREMLLNKEKYHYRTDKVDKVFKFISYLNIEHKNEYILMDLMPWQAFILAYAYGFYYQHDHTKRVIREIFLFVARKNGKTAFSSAMQMYGMLADGVINPQSILLASVSAQATIALNFAKSMVNHSPPLKARLIGQRSRIIFRDSEKQGFSQIFSSIDPGRLEGYSPSTAILDEAFMYQDNMVYQAIKTGTGARINPMLYVISTAGSKNNGFLNDHLKHNQDILDGRIEDENTLAMIYQPDEGDDLKNPECWAKANPSIGIINSLEDLLTAYKQAKHSAKDQFIFITKHLNLFYDTPETWIPEDYLIPCFEEFDETQFYKRDVFIGCDLSKNTDLSSAVVYIPGENGEKSYAFPLIWMANMPQNMIRKNGMDMSNWIFDNHIEKLTSRTIDLDLIFDAIMKISEDFNIISFSYDPYNSPVLVSRLKEQGINCEKFLQNASKFNASLKLIEEMIYKQTLVMKNPAMLWQFGNVVLYIDGNGNIKIVKNRQNDSVDTIVALGMAVGGWINYTYGEEIMGINAYIDQMQAK